MQLFKANYFGRNFEDNTIEIELIVVAEDLDKAKKLVENHADVVDGVPPEHIHEFKYTSVDLDAPSAFIVSYCDFSG